MLYRLNRLSGLRLAAAVCILLLMTAGAATGCKKKDNSANSKAGEEKPEEGPTTDETESDPAGDEGESLAEGERPEELPPDEVPPEPAEADNPSEFPPEFLKGRLGREKVVETYPEWKESVTHAQPDKQPASKLSEVDPGAKVTVYFGTWCGDSIREVSRFWKTLDVAGDVPFDIEYVAVDPDFDAGDISLEGVDLYYVPTFVVSRGGNEVGRVVETSPDGIESDLLALLKGEKEGVVSTRDDL